MRYWLVMIWLILGLTRPLWASDVPPRTIPTDENGRGVALQYFQRTAQNALALEQYEEATLRTSAALVGATGRENSTAVTGLESYRVAFIYLNVTAMTRPDANETLDVVIETSHDSGTTWLRIARFTQVATAGAQTQLMVLNSAGNTTPVADPSGTDPASGAISTGAFSDRVRVASTYTDPAGANGTSTFSVTAFFKR